MPRIDGRLPHELRPVKITPGYLSYAEGSALIETGETRVVCAVSVEERLPQWLRGQGRGWVTAEYAMLPRATLTRTPREQSQGRTAGRSLEIGRLVGRSLRAVTDLRALGERTLTVDCDVLQADGGTRTAAVTGSYVALYMALARLARQGAFSTIPLLTPVAAVSVGVVGEELLLDLCYEEDFGAAVDFNVVMTGDGRLVELQGAAEGPPFPRSQVEAILDLAEAGLRQLFRLQREALGV